MGKLSTPLKKTPLHCAEHPAASKGRVRVEGLEEANEKEIETLKVSTSSEVATPTTVVPLDF